MNGWARLYAVTRDDVRAGSAPARIITAAGLRAWGGDAPERAGEVCLRLARKGGVLPARAGARIEGGANAVRAWLRASSEALAAKLDEIADRVEFVATLRDALADAPTAPRRAGSGAGYLRAAAASAAERRDRQERLMRWADEIADALPGPLASAPRRVADAGPGRVDLSVLAPRAAKPVFALGIADCARRLAPGFSLEGSGPWAPHSFADLVVDATAAAGARATQTWSPAGQRPAGR